MNKKIIISLAGILLLAGILRFHNLWAGDLTTDEAKTALGIAYPHSFVLPQMAVLSQKIFGVSEWAVRAPFALLGIITVGLWYLVGTKLKDKNFGLLLAGLATIIPTNVIFSRSAYLDAPVIAGWLMVLYFWLRTEKESVRPVNFIGLWFFLALAPFLKLQAIYLHLALGILILWHTKGKFWVDTRTWIIGISVLPIIGYVLGQPQQMYDIYAYVFEQSPGISQTDGLGGFVFQLGFWLWPFLILSIVGLWRSRQLPSFYQYLPFWLTGCLALVFSVLGTRQLYYSAMLDVFLVVGGGLGILWFTEKKQVLSILSGVVLVGWSSLILIKKTDLIYPCQPKPLERCYWWFAGNEYDWVGSVGQRADRIYFLDDNLGYTPKWVLRGETKKLDALPTWLKTKEKDAVVIIRQTTELPIAGNFRPYVQDQKLKVILIPKDFDKPGLSR